ncbi:hypothetical protein MKX01_015406 [Papaver californicum]|nr:hypothetical protein MKX01_015406 [Papaver californicum]
MFILIIHGCTSAATFTDDHHQQQQYQTDIGRNARENPSNDDSTPAGFEAGGSATYPFIVIKPQKEQWYASICTDWRTLILCRCSCYGRLLLSLSCSPRSGAHLN